MDPELEGGNSFDMESGVELLEEGLSTEIGAPEGEETPKPAEGVEAKPAEGEQAPEGEQKPVEGEQKPADSNDKAPDTWTAVGKEKWAGLPPEVKEEIRKREGDIANFVHQNQSMLSVGKFMQAEMGKYNQIYQQKGINPGQLIPTLLQSHAVLVTGSPEERAAVVRAIAQGAGLDINLLAQGGDGSHPLVTQLQQQVVALQSQLSEVTTGLSAQNYSKLEAEVNEFIDSKDADGQLKHPHFDLVWQDMKVLLESKLAKGLQDAYDQAIWRNPVTRNKETDRVAAAKAEKARKEAAEKVDKARRASSANVRSSGTGSRGAPATNWEDDLGNIMEDITTRTS